MIFGKKTGPADFILQKMLGEFRVESAKTIHSILNVDLGSAIYLHDISSIFSLYYYL